MTNSKLFHYFGASATGAAKYRHTAVPIRYFSYYVKTKVMMEWSPQPYWNEASPN